MSPDSARGYCRRVGDLVLKLSVNLNTPTARFSRKRQLLLQAISSGFKSAVAFAHPLFAAVGHRFAPDGFQAIRARLVDPLPRCLNGVLYGLFALCSDFGYRR